MDRTNWKWGKSNTNILFLGVAYKGISIPICGISAIDKDFCSNHFLTGPKLSQGAYFWAIQRVNAVDPIIFSINVQLAFF